jgi:hypothetical protein
MLQQYSNAMFYLISFIIVQWKSVYDAAKTRAEKTRRTTTITSKT